jgi:putative membrane protein
MINGINESLSSSSDVNQQELQNKLQNDIKRNLTSSVISIRPSGNVTLEKLYDGVSSLSDGIDKESQGQGKLNTGIKTLTLGLGKLQNGSQTLTSGIETLNSGLSKTLSCAQVLNLAGSKGLSNLSSGISKLNDGAQKMLTQFSSSGNPNKPTIFDGVSGVAKGAQSLSSNLNSYVSAANNTFYLMITSNPSSAELLTGYKISLKQVLTAYGSTTDATAKAQYEKQIQGLSNLVDLYTAGTDEAVKNEQQFEVELLNMSQQNKANQNIVSSGNGIIAGAAQLSSASQQTAAVFNNGGKFKSSMEQIAKGAAALNQNSASLTTLKTGIYNITNALSQLQNGTENLVTGSQNLQSGLVFVKNGSNKLLSGSSQLIDANAKIYDGALQLKSGLGLAGQQSEIQVVMNKISSEKDDKIAGAFDKTFMVASIILLFASICGLFTDKKGGNAKKM